MNRKGMKGVLGAGFLTSSSAADSLRKLRIPVFLSNSTDEQYAA